jgi:hypothetical protein
MEIDWIKTDKCFAYLVTMGAYYSIVNRTGVPGEEEQIESDDIEPWEERAIEYESDGPED